MPVFGPMPPIERMSVPGRIVERLEISDQPEGCSIGEDVLYVVNSALHVALRSQWSDPDRRILAVA
jgi:hypothetical protein